MKNQKKKDLAKIALTAFMLSAALPAAGNAAVDTGIQGTVLAGGGCGGSARGHCGAASRPSSNHCGAASQPSNHCGAASPSNSHCGAATQPSYNCGAIPTDGGSSIKPNTYKPYMPNQTNQPAGKPTSQPNKPVSRPVGQPSSRSMRPMNEPFSTNDNAESRWDSKTVAVESMNDQRGYGMKPQDQVPGKSGSDNSTNPMNPMNPMTTPNTERR